MGFDPRISRVFGLALTAAGLALGQVQEGPQKLQRWQAGGRFDALLALASAGWFSWRRLRRQYQALLKTQRRLGALIGSASDIFLIVNERGTILYQSAAAASLWGYTLDGLVGENTIGLIHDDDVEEARRSLAQAIAAPTTKLVFECRLRRADDSWREHEVIVTSLLDDPAVEGVLLTCRDITERRALERDLTHQAFHDPLTTLANRALFLNRVEHALWRAERSDHRPAVLYIDLDSFKSVNDNLGHQAGDILLVAFAERLLTHVRLEDTVARLGGDEFAILVEGNHGVDEATLIAERIVDALAVPFQIDGQTVDATASIGIAAVDLQTRDAASLLRAADLALYRAKVEGKARYVLFEYPMQSDMVERITLQNDLRIALDHQEFRVYYQPIVSLENGVALGYEALVRWDHPTRGLLEPSEFIGVAEETGLIIPIGRWVLETACHQLRTWQAQNPSSPPVQMSVNVSVRQLSAASFVDDLAAVLASTAVDPGTVKLEITEAMLLSETAPISAALQRIHALGVKLAIDDFGTGFASLANIRKFPIDVVKIDQSFVRDLGTSPACDAIVRNIIELARSLQLPVIAEGVETDEQRQMLWNLGCDLGQGYHFARPLTAETAGERASLGRRPGGDGDGWPHQDIAHGPARTSSGDSGCGPEVKSSGEDTPLTSLNHSAGPADDSSSGDIVHRQERRMDPMDSGWETILPIAEPSVFVVPSGDLAPATGPTPFQDGLDVN